MNNPNPFTRNKIIETLMFPIAIVVMIIVHIGIFSAFKFCQLTNRLSKKEEV